MVRQNKIRLSFGDKAFYVIVYSLSILLLAIVAYPLVYVVSASLSDPIAVMSGAVKLFPKGLNIRAYQEVFKSSEIMMGYMNTIKYTFLGTLINMVLTTMCAYPLSRPDLKGKNTITMIITFTLFFSGGMIPTYITIRNLHMLDTIWAMVLPTAINVTNMLIMRNYFQHSMPNELIEAAYVDGCSNVGILMKIVLPLSKSIMGVLVIYYFVGHWNTYFNALLYLTTESKFPLQVFLRQLLIQTSAAELSGASDSVADLALLAETLKYAVIVVASLPALVIYPFMQKFFTKGIMIGAIKG